MPISIFGILIIFIFISISTSHSRFRMIHIEYMMMIGFYDRFLPARLLFLANFIFTFYIVFIFIGIGNIIVPIFLSLHSYLYLYIYCSLSLLLLGWMESWRFIVGIAEDNEYLDWHAFSFWFLAPLFLSLSLSLSLFLYFLSISCIIDNPSINHRAIRSMGIGNAMIDDTIATIC